MHMGNHWQTILHKSMATTNKKTTTTTQSSNSEQKNAKHNPDPAPHLTQKPPQPSPQPHKQVGEMSAQQLPTTSIERNNSKLKIKRQYQTNLVLGTVTKLMMAVKVVGNKSSP